MLSLNRFGKLILETVAKSDPAGLDDVLVHADSPPEFLAVATLDNNAGRRRGSRVGIQNANLIVDELHFVKLRVDRLQGFAQRIVERVDRTVAFSDLVTYLAMLTNTEFYSRYRCVVRFLRLVVDNIDENACLIVDPVKTWGKFTFEFVDE